MQTDISDILRLGWLSVFLCGAAIVTVRSNEQPLEAEMKIADSTVLLTGATGGLGQAIAGAFAAKGADLVLSGRRAAALESALASARAAMPDGGSARTVVADLSEAADVERLAGEAGDVGILIANAAMPASGEVLDYTPEQIDRALLVNLRSQIMLCRLLAPAMVAAGRGHIVFVGSLSGKAASPAASLYNATKFGLRGFALGLRQDLHGTGVGVSVVQPSFVRDAGMFADTGATPPGNARTVSPEQVAAGVIRAIEKDRAEINVAPVELRLGGALAGLFPDLSARVQRRMVKDGSLDQIVASQRDRR
jgi:short-subunit dehydrogenase